MKTRYLLIGDSLYLPIESLIRLQAISDSPHSAPIVTLTFTNNYQVTLHPAQGADPKAIANDVFRLLMESEDNPVILTKSDRIGSITWPIR